MPPNLPEPSWLPTIPDCRYPNSSLQGYGIMKRSTCFWIISCSLSQHSPNSWHQRHPPPPQIDLPIKYQEDWNKDEAGLNSLSVMFTWKSIRSKNFWEKYPLNCNSTRTSDKGLQIYETLGLGQEVTVDTFSGFIWVPSRVMKYPKNDADAA